MLILRVKNSLTSTKSWKICKLKKEESMTYPTFSKHFVSSSESRKISISGVVSKVFPKHWPVLKMTNLYLKIQCLANSKQKQIRKKCWQVCQPDWLVFSSNPKKKNHAWHLKKLLEISVVSTLLLEKSKLKSADFMIFQMFSLLWTFLKKPWSSLVNQLTFITAFLDFLKSKIHFAVQFKILKK